MARPSLQISIFIAPADPPGIDRNQREMMIALKDFSMTTAPDPGALRETRTYLDRLVR